MSKMHAWDSKGNAISDPELLEGMERGEYGSICSDDEIERIFRPASASDYLLKVRADTAFDNMRLFRVIFHRARRNEKKRWKLVNFFNDRLFKKYLGLAAPEFREKCRSLTAGFMLSNDPNGAYELSPFGNIMSVSLSLKYFLFYMNIGFMNSGVEIPIHVRINAIRIAIRTMLKTEALDFDMDPRGILPRQLRSHATFHTNLQLSFIIGHEYAHHFCDHLDPTRTGTRHRFLGFADEKPSGAFVAYNQSQKEEFQADKVAIASCSAAPERTQLAFSAITWLSYLDFYYDILDVISPRNPYAYNTHPEPIDRKNAIIEEFGQTSPGLREYGTQLSNIVDSYRQHFVDDISFNIERYETYGSAYLDAPNTKWRGRELVDRVDYY